MTQLVDWDKPLEDEAGNYARLLSKDFMDGTWHNLCVVQVTTSKCSSGMLYYYHDGRPYGHNIAIRNRKEKREGWVNVYCIVNGPNKYLKTGMQVYKSEQAAIDIGKFHNGANCFAENLGLPRDKHDTMQHRTYIATVKIEVEV